MLSDVQSQRTAPPSRVAAVGVGYNGSRRSAAALAVGRELAAAHGACIKVMQVVCPTRGDAGIDARPLLGGAAQGTALAYETLGFGGRVDALLRQARERLAGLEGVEGSAVYGIVEDELAAFAEEVDLLVIGLGSQSTSAYLQRHARCPVLVVPRARPTCAGAVSPFGPLRSSRSRCRERSCGR